MIIKYIYHSLVIWKGSRGGGEGREGPPSALPRISFSSFTRALGEGVEGRDLSEGKKKGEKGGYSAFGVHQSVPSIPWMKGEKSRKGENGRFRLPSISRPFLPRGDQEKGGKGEQEGKRGGGRLRPSLLLLIPSSWRGGGIRNHGRKEGEKKRTLPLVRPLHSILASLIRRGKKGNQGGRGRGGERGGRAYRVSFVEH